MSEHQRGLRLPAVPGADYCEACLADEGDDAEYAPLAWDFGYAPRQAKAEYRCWRGHEWWGLWGDQTPDVLAARG